MSIHLAADQLPDLDGIDEVISAGTPRNTRLAYDQDWHRFQRWCREQRGYGAAWTECPAPVSVVLAYLRDVREAGGAIASARRYATSISHVHAEAGHPSPSSHPRVLRFLRGWQKSGATPQRQVEPLTVEALRYACNWMPRSLLGIRDRALLLVGWAGGMRADELIRLRRDDVELRDHDGGAFLVITIRSDKTHTRPRRVPLVSGQTLRACPVDALREWMGVAPDQNHAAPLFQSLTTIVWRRKTLRAGDPIARQTVIRAVKRAASCAGLDPTRYGGHSLRAGLITACQEAQVSDGIIQQTTGHRSRDRLATYARSRPTPRVAAARGIL